MEFFNRLFSKKADSSKPEKHDLGNGFTLNEKGEVSGTFKQVINGEEISIPINTTVDKLKEEYERSNDPHSCIREPDKDEIKIPVEGFVLKFKANISRHVLDDCQIATLKGYNNFLISKTDYDSMVEKDRQYQEFEKLLFESAQLNNKGILLEKQGNIQEAIETYEENIKIGYPATHSFERLMILYRKGKSPHEELRVIEKAIEVFLVKNIYCYDIDHPYVKRKERVLSILKKQ